MDDPFNLERFVIAQNASGTFDRALSELRQGHKTSHWMWFIFPQFEGLGQSSKSQHARAYFALAILGPAPGVRGGHCIRRLSDRCGNLWRH